MKKVIFSVAAALLLSSNIAIAKSSVEVSNEALKIAKKESKKNSAHIIEEAVKAVALTQKVLVDIEKKDKESAIKDIEAAIGKLEVALSAEKSLKFLPVDVAVTSVEYIGNVKKIKDALHTVKKLLNDGKVQEARVLLNTLRSELDLITVSIPVATYPDALKLASKYIHNNELDKAKEVLAIALSTLTKDVVVVPIPIIKAQALIEAASKIAKKDKEQALKHLQAAHDELKKAELLGYVSKSDVTYKDLQKAIKKTEKEIKGKNKAEKLFEDLINKIKSFKEKM